MSQRPIIHWFRHDLRLDDNTALHAACQRGQPVIPLFILDPTILSSERVGPARIAFLYRALASLDDSLRALGTRLFIRHGEPLTVLRDLIHGADAEVLTFNADVSPYARQRDATVQDALDIEVRVYDDLLLIPPGGVLKQDGDPYVVFTPFKRTWNEQSKPPVSDYDIREARFVGPDAHHSEALPTVDDETIPLPPATESAAHERLEAFIQRDVHRYDELRNALVIDPFAQKAPAGTSYLSPYLRLGLLSIRRAYWSARDAYSRVQLKSKQESIATWVSELTWREFYNHILYHFPHVLKRDFVDTYLDLEWQQDDEALNAWKKGETGYPIIDAPMRQLKAIGWMPNRARMIVASFLTKDLLIHWREGDLHFMQHLIDGDPAANNGGWQWAAGTGTDAQPYFRIFNPVSQSQKFATAAYLRHWLPELADVPDKFIHTPWEMKQPPRAYPAPIVDHKQAREQTLSAFKAARKES